MLEESPPDIVKLCLVGNVGVGKRSIAKEYLRLCSTPDYAAEQERSLGSLSEVNVQRVIGTIRVVVNIFCANSSGDALTLPIATRIMASNVVVLVFDLEADRNFALASDIVRSLDLMSSSMSGKKLHYVLVGTMADKCRQGSAEIAVSMVAPHLKRVVRYAVSSKPGYTNTLLESFDAITAATHARLVSRATKAKPATLGTTQIAATLPDVPAGSATYGTATTNTTRSGSSASKTMNGGDDSDDDNRVAKGIVKQLPSIPVVSQAQVGKPMETMTLANNPLVDPELDSPMCTCSMQ